jgi:hypothetical protein
VLHNGAGRVFAGSFSHRCILTASISSSELVPNRFLMVPRIQAFAPLVDSHQVASRSGNQR